MIERFNVAPWTFWLHLVVLAVLLFESLRKWHLPWAKPAVVVYGTVIFWYTGDFLLSTSIAYQVFAKEVITLAFFQVSIFLIGFRFLLGYFSRRFCEKPLRIRKNQFIRGTVPKHDSFSPRFLKSLLALLISGWFAIFLIGVSFSPSVWPALIWPPLLSEKIGMYPLERVGSGASFIFNAIGYIHILICSLFGVIAVTARGPIRWIAIMMVFLTWPYFWFDRYRNRMLALLLPGLAGFLLLGKHRLTTKIAVGAIFSIGLSVWFSKVMESRSERNLTAFLENGAVESAGGVPKKSEGREGQDMLKELCWINTYVESGRYRPNWGARYFGEIVNPIPRTLWPGKPMVGIDYSIARGFGASREAAGVNTTISTGMIGQGCVNFGRFFGPPVAALLFALWAAFLARLWCQRAVSLRLALFLIGMGLTLNTGRDLTFLVLFPFAFGYIALRLFELSRHRSPDGTAPRRSLSSPQNPIRPEKP